MRLIIAGGRTMRPTDTTVDGWVTTAVQRFGLGPVSCVLSGGAQGIDRAGEQWARMRGVKVERHPPDWVAFGKAAGPIRNRAMVLLGDALICCWDGRSRGSRSILEAARARGIPPLEVTWPVGQSGPDHYAVHMPNTGQKLP